MTLCDKTFEFCPENTVVPGGPLHHSKFKADKTPMDPFLWHDPHLCGSFKLDPSMCACARVYVGDFESSSQYQRMDMFDKGHTHASMFAGKVQNTCLHAMALNSEPHLTLRMI